MATHHCSDCGAECQGKRCRACSDLALGRKPKRIECKCLGCGKPYENKRRSSKEGASYCSRECYFQRRRDDPAQSFIRYTVVQFLRCKHCDGAFVQRTAARRIYCSPECAYAARPTSYRPAPLRDRCCAHCGKGFKGHGGSAYCSLRCARKVYRKRYGHDRGKARHRARRAGVAYEPVNPISVFERDGWRCQICGKDTPRARRGTNYPNAPELDHRVPIAKGGPHLYANVQCACRACNGAKGARLIVGQLPLWNQRATGGRSTP